MMRNVCSHYMSKYVTIGMAKEEITRTVCNNGDAMDKSLITPRKAIPTLNGYGWQYATPSPLLENWIASYDKKHPLLDVGCAYGINTFEALAQGIPTIALDIEEGHLDYIRKTVPGKYKPLLTCVLGSLPDNTSVPDNSVSGILIAEVLHFLMGNDVEDSLVTLRQKLVKGGKLLITTVSEKSLAYVSAERQANFYRHLSKGDKWPGVVQVDESFVSTFSRFMKSDDFRAEYRKQMPDYVQVFSQSQMVNTLERTGFDVKIAKYGSHPGYPDPDGIGQLEELHLLVVAEKNN